jgi:hypothetical protein
VVPRTAFSRYQDLNTEYSQTLNQLLLTSLVAIDKQPRSSKDTSTSDSWHTPKLILMFLENTIRENTVKPKLHSWSAFKALLFSIYDHRIMHS